MLKHRYLKFLAVFLVMAMTGQLCLSMGPAAVAAETETSAAAGAAAQQKAYKLWYNTPASGNADPNHADNNVVGNLVGSWNDRGWQNESMPLGNGYIGANVWGKTTTERINIAETSIQNKSSAGLSSLMNVYMDFNHTGATGYYRDLNLNDGIANVSYTVGAGANAVTYTREYLTSYPDKVMAIRLTASQPGALSFNLRPNIPFVRNSDNQNGYDFTLNNVARKTANVTADAPSKTITLAGEMTGYGTEYEAQVRVINTGGTVTAGSWNFNPGTTTNMSQSVNLGASYTAGSLQVSNANEVVILISVATNYPLDNQTFYSDPGVFTRADGEKMSAYRGKGIPHAKATAIMDAAAAKGFAQIKTAHMADYKSFFDRATIDLGGNAADTRTTVQLLNSHKGGGYEPYLEELVFQFGRYLLICSSREGGFPAHLQGIWNAYEIAPWSGGYWHNINLQENYWPAFNTNLIDLFKSYADYNAAFRGAARQNADSYLGTGTVTGTTGALSNAAVNTGVKAGNNQGLNGWAIGTGTWPYRAGAPETDTHSGPGTGGMTTSLFWEYYDFTRDPNILKDVTYPAVSEMANFLSKTLVKAGDTFLVKESASPEQNGKNQNHPGTRPDYYRTIGTAFDQQMVYDVYRTALAGIDALKANFTASQLTGLLGFDQALFNSAFANYGNLPVYNNPINSYSTSVINNPNGKLGTVYTSFENLLKDQINKLEPVIIGRSGQVKEYREESFYLVNGATGASIGDPTHRHISNLIGLYPGTVINSTTPHWFDGAKVTLNERGDGGTGWAIGHKFNFWARMADGNRAYALYRNLIRTSVYENLWGMHAPFQIDANFAATAGVAEMLLGSHEGFISLLPSRPDKWATGSFRGLTARGGFEVDAVWSNQQAQQFAVKSNAGEVCALKYFNIAGAVVKDSKGNTVSFTADGTDLISFPTVKGETYTVTDIPAFTKTAPPADLQLSTNSAGAQLSWNASPDAASYNVYVAEGSQPDYTLLANVGEELDFTAPKNGTYAGGFQFSPTADQFTFRVTAVAADGRESEGVTQLLIPPLAPASAAGVFGSGGVLGVTVTLDPRAVASSYKLYERVGTTSTYNQIAVSDYPILYATGTDSAREYYVTAYNAFTGESARARVTPQTTQPAIDNVFKGKPFTFAAKGGVDVALDSHPIARIVDGDRTSRFAMDDGKWNNVASPRTFTLEIDLLNEYALDSITFYEFQERTTTYEFRVWSQGKWTDIPASGWSKSAVTSQSNPENTRIYTITFTNPKPVAEKIQVILGGNSAPTFYEIECKTAVTAAVDKSALLALIHEADAVDRQKGFGVNWPPAKYTEYTTAKSNALTTLTSGAADQNRVNANITALRAILDQADALSRAALPDLIAKAEAYIAGKTGLEKQVAQALINTVLAEAKAVTSAAPLADVHTALYKLNTALNKADAEIGARTALFGLIADAAQFLQNMNTSSPLHDPVLEQEIKDAKAFAEQVSAADSPMAALSEVLFAANRLQKAMDAYTTAAGAELTLSLPDGGIFTAAQTLTLTCPSGNITDFYYTIDGSTPTTASRKVLDKAISLPHGFYTLKAAGFINNAAVTNIAEAKFFVVKTDNVVRGATMTATSSLADPPVSVPEFAPASAADGSVSSRWANQGGSPMWLQADIGRQVTVDTVIIHDFLEAVDPTTRLGSNFTIQVQSGASWQTLYTGSAEIIGTVPLGSAAGITGGLKQRAGEQRQVYAIKLAAPVTGQVFRLNDMGGGATIWEFELYEPDTTPPPSNDANLSALSVSPGTLTPAFNPATLNYAVSLPAGTNSITVSATANHAEAKISGDGVRALIPGVNTLPVAVLAQDETTTRTYTITVTVGEPLPGTPPTITGPAGMTVRGKYEAVSTDPFVIGGTAPVTVTKTSGDGKIVWNSDTLSLDIQAGLAPGVYETVLKASNGIAPDAECTFILTVALPWGNVSGSGTLNISDARMVLQHLVDKIKLSEELQDLADVDGKDGVTITDARLILQRLVEKIPAFPREITP